MNLDPVDQKIGLALQLNAHKLKINSVTHHYDHWHLVSRSACCKKEIVQNHEQTLLNLLNRNLTSSAEPTVPKQEIKVTG
jgi:hypothetical protein